MRRLLVMAMLLLGLMAPAMAQEKSAPETVIETLLKQPAQAGQFSEAFLHQVPLAQIEGLLNQVRSTIGVPEQIVAKGRVYEISTQTYSMDVEISLDEAGKVTALLLHPPLSNKATIADVVGAIGKLPGEVSYLVSRDGEVLADKDADKPLAVGSAFKLGIMALLKEAVDRGDVDWDTVIPVGAHSLPTGMLQTFPEGSPVTVYTAAALMISISDNTATDMLIDLVGREALAQKLGIDFAMKTREFFFLKGDAAAKADYLKADAAGKLALVEGLADKPTPALNAVMPVLDAGLEWYVPASKLCELLSEVEGLDVMSINPGVANPADWAHVAHKGGSETGVLNLSTLVTDAQGRKSCVVMTINDSKPVNENGVSEAYRAVLKTLART